MTEDIQLLKEYYSRYGGFWRFPEMLDYCYLVNPYFRQSAIIDEMEANFRLLLGEYPSGLRVNTQLASKCWGVSEDKIIPGNGAAELIKALMECTTGKIGVIRPTFEEYPNRLSEQQIVPYIPNNNEFRYTIEDLMDFYQQNPVNSLILINPDNPSGNYISKQEIYKLASWCKSKTIRLIVDESFVDFCEDWEHASLLSDEDLNRFPNLCVIKSISKSYGVPGLRLGILASADSQLMKQLRTKVSIWNINSFAEFFMQILPKYQDDYHRACEQFIVARQSFITQLQQIPYLHIMPTQANFVFCEVISPYTANGLATQLLKDHQILISACGAKKGIQPNRYVRLAVRSTEDNEKMIQALRTISKAYETKQ